MTGRAVSIQGASLTLQHVPDLVRYGSKPRRETASQARIADALRTFDRAAAYPPNRVTARTRVPMATSTPLPTAATTPATSNPGVMGQPTYFRADS